MKFTGVFLLLIVVFCSCNSGETTPVPRPKAFPRISLYDSSKYVVPDSFPVVFPVNAQAVYRTSARDGGAWLTIDYPRYNATVYVTYSLASDSLQLAQIVDNRLERISLNIGDGAMIDEMDIESDGGFDSRLILSRNITSTPTPLNFISIAKNQNAGVVVSGSVAFSDHRRGIDSDSIAPVVDALVYDLSHSLSSIQLR